MNIEEDEYCTADYGAFGSNSCSCSSCQPRSYYLSKAEIHRRRKQREREEYRREVSRNFNLHMIDLYNRSIR